MHVLWISEFPPTTGGISDYSRCVVGELADRGHRVDVVSTAAEAPDALSDGVSFIGSVPRANTSFGLLRAAREWERYLTNEYNATVVQFPGFSPKSLALYRLFHRRIPRSVLTIHEPPPNARIIPFLENFEALSFLSDPCRQAFERSHPHYLRLARPAMHDLPYFGVDPDIVERVRGRGYDLAVNDDGPTIVCPGLVIERKRYHLVVEALAHLRDTHPYAELIFAGGVRDKDDPAYLARIESLASANGVADAVTVTGLIEEDRVNAYMLAADVVVLPYREIYQSSVLVKCLALGTPPVVSPIDGLRIPVERYGGLVLDDVGSVEIARTLEGILTAGEAVDGNQIRSELSWDRVVERYEDVFQRL